MRKLVQVHDEKSDKRKEERTREDILQVLYQSDAQVNSGTDAISGMATLEGMMARPIVQVNSGTDATSRIDAICRTDATFWDDIRTKDSGTDPMIRCGPGTKRPVTFTTGRKLLQVHDENSYKRKEYRTKEDILQVRYQSDAQVNSGTDAI